VLRRKLSSKPKGYKGGRTTLGGKPFESKGRQWGERKIEQVPEVDPDGRRWELKDHSRLARICTKNFVCARGGDKGL